MKKWLPEEIINHPCRMCFGPDCPIPEKFHLLVDSIWDFFFLFISKDTLEEGSNCQCHRFVTAQQEGVGKNCGDGL